MQADAFRRVFVGLLEHEGITPTPIESYDDFMTNSLKAVIESFKIVTPGTSYKLAYCGVEPPEITPDEARVHGKDYTARVYIYVVHELPGRVDHVRASLCDIPVMIGSRLSNHDPVKQERMGILDPGGYFIMEGKEKVLMMQENSKPRFPGLYVRRRGNTPTPTVVFTSGENVSGLDSRVLNVFETPKPSGPDKESRYRGLSISTPDMLEDGDPPSIFALFVCLYMSLERKLTRLAASSKGRRGHQQVLRSLKFTRKVLSSVQELTQEVLKNAQRLTAPRQEGDDEEYLYRVESLVYSCAHEVGWDTEPSDLVESFMKSFKTKYGDTGEFVDKVSDMVFKNAENTPGGIQSKINTLTYMLVKYAGFQAGKRELDSMDNWANKKITTAGEHMRGHFSTALKKLVDEIQSKYHNTGINIETIKQVIENSNTITASFTTSFRGQTWGPWKNTGREDKVVDSILRDTTLAMYAHLTKIRTPGSTNMASNKRQVMVSQYGYGCAVATPDGENVGLVKDHTITTRITCDSDHKAVIDLVRGVGKGLMSTSEPIRKDDYTLVFINGLWFGYADGDGSALRDKLVDARLSGKMNRFVEVVLVPGQREMFIYCDAGRMVRPLLKVNKATCRHVFEETDWWRDVLSGKRVCISSIPAGSIDYIGASEVQGYYVLEDPTRLADIRARMDELSPREIPDYTEISPEAILGVSASSLPYISMSHGPRLVYQANMNKQAIGADTVGTKGSRRINSTMTYSLDSPDVPLVYTSVGTALGLDKFPIGQQVICAIMPYGGGNEEDALILDQGAVDRGLFGYTLYYGYTAVSQSNGAYQDVFGVLPGRENSPTYRNIIRSGYEEGLARQGSELVEGDCVIARYTVDRETGVAVDSSVYVGFSEGGVVAYSEYVLSGPEKTARVRLEQKRKPAIGDKLASRYAQKGVVGQILPSDHMPRIVSDDPMLDGVIPSVLFNPHGIPTRMTVGKVVEMSSGLVGYKTMKRSDASPFKKVDVNALQDELVRNGFSRDGTVKMRLGKDGPIIDSPIFVGPVYYQLLKHFSHKKSRARGIDGPIDPETRQPRRGMAVSAGKITSGSIRCGHMEITALRGMGASGVLLERGIEASDKFVVHLCQNCGGFMFPSVLGTNCKNCGSGSTVRVTTSYALVMIKHLLAGLGINMGTHTSREMSLDRRLK